MCINIYISGNWETQGPIMSPRVTYTFLSCLSGNGNTDGSVQLSQSSGPGACWPPQVSSSQPLSEASEASPSLLTDLH